MPRTSARGCSVQTMRLAFSEYRAAPDPSSRARHRIFFRDKGEYLEIFRVLDRKEAYR